MSFTQTKAAPSIYGSGSYVTGGRGGVVVHVTNLNNSGSGSLRDALLMTVPRIIVFDVSGRVHLTSMIELIDENSDFTILGQTAPEGGITISGKPLQLGGGYGRANQPCNNVIIRFVRFRNGSYTGVGDEYLHNGLISTGTDGLVVDHCSFSFNDDQAISLIASYGNLDNITVSRCVFSENATGLVLGLNTQPMETRDISIHQNLFKDQMHRQPNYGGVGQIDIVNNVHDNFPSRLVNINSSGSKDVNYIANYIRRGASSTNDSPNKVQSPADVSIYTRDNYHSTLQLTPVLDNQNLWAVFPDNVALSGSSFTLTMHPLLGDEITILTAQLAFISVTNNVGANKYLNADGTVGEYVDSYDNLLISNTVNEIDSDRNDKTWVQPTLPNNTRPVGYYSSNSHIPEVWFLANVPNGEDELDIAPSGYTWIEEFANQVDTGNSPSDVPSEPVSIKPKRIYINSIGSSTFYINGEKKTN